MNEALKKHLPWRGFLYDRIGRKLSNNEYDKLDSFTELRDGVMHGRILFPVYREFIRLTHTHSSQE